MQNWGNTAYTVEGTLSNDGTHLPQKVDAMKEAATYDTRERDMACERRTPHWLSVTCRVKKPRSSRVHTYASG